jgi:TM2 domain-containing membrane protein YozV
MVKSCQVTCSGINYDESVWGCRPSLGITLLFATFGFGADRFYVGQAGLGIGLLVAYLTVFGLIVALPVQFLSQLSLVFAILLNKQTAFMYGSYVIFDVPTIVDKVIAALWLLLMVFFFILTISLAVVRR